MVFLETKPRPAARRKPTSGGRSEQWEASRTAWKHWNISPRYWRTNFDSSPPDRLLRFRPRLCRFLGDELVNGLDQTPERTL